MRFVFCAGTIQSHGINLTDTAVKRQLAAATRKQQEEETKRQAEAAALVDVLRLQLKSGARSATFCAIYLQKRTFKCQDRLGTNIGKLRKEWRRFSQPPTALRASSGVSPPSRGKKKTVLCGRFSM
jgi:hypothetical protein